MKWQVNFSFRNTVLLIAFCVLCMGIWSRWFGFDGMYGQDAYNYLRQLKSFPIYSQPEFWPIGFAFLAQPFRWLPGGDFFALQSCSLTAWAGIGVLLWHNLKTKVAHSRFGFFWFLGWLCSPLWLRSALLGMSDASACLGIAMVLFCISSTAPERWLWVAVVGTLMAVLTRYACAVVLAPAWLWLSYRGIMQKMWGWSHILCCAAGGLVLVFHFVFFSSLGGSIHHPWLEQWDIRNAFSRTFEHQDGRMSYALPNILFIVLGGLHPGFGIGFSFWILFVPAEDRSMWWKITLGMAIVYSVFLMGIPFQNLRFMLPLSLLHYVLGFSGFLHVVQRFPRYSLLAWLVVVPLLALPRALQPFVARQQFEQMLAERMKPYSGATLYTFDVDGALRARGFSGTIINLWEGPVHRFHKGAFLLYHPSLFKKQWSGAWPEKNYSHAGRVGLHAVEQLPFGWKLYRIK